MHIASVSTEYPAPWGRHRGLFIQRRLAALAHLEDVTVVHAVPWFPIARPWPGGRRPSVTEDREAPRVRHRRMFYLPGILKGLDSHWLKTAVLAAAGEIQRACPIDVIDAHFGYPEGVGCVGAALALGRPVFITMRGLERPILTHAWRGGQLLRALRQCTGIVAVSESLKVLAVERGIAPEKIEVIPNAVDRQTFRPGDRDEARRALGLALSDQLVVSVGMLVAGKGHHHLVDAIARLRTKDHRLRLAIIGGAAHEPAYPELLRRRIAERELEGIVRLEGNLPPAAVATWLQAADVFALSTDDEGCCNAILEAMACGLPVVTTPAGDNALLVDPPKRGFIVPTGWSDDLCQALEAAVQTAWDRGSIAAHAADYTWDEVAGRTARFFRERTGMGQSRSDSRPRELSPL
jgi:glycosyltransferase involved in cell wall biosynthesis